MGGGGSEKVSGTVRENERETVQKNRGNKSG